MARVQAVEVTSDLPGGALDAQPLGSPRGTVMKTAWGLTWAKTTPWGTAGQKPKVAPLPPKPPPQEEQTQF